MLDLCLKATPDNIEQCKEALIIQPNHTFNYPYTDYDNQLANCSIQNERFMHNDHYYKLLQLVTQKDKKLWLRCITM